MNQVSIKRCRPLLGTFVEVNLTAKMSEKALIHWSNMAFDEIERIHQTLSFHQLDSELSALNIALITAPNAQFTMSADLQNVVTFAQQVFEQSNGYYDISIAAPLVASKHLPAHLFADKAVLLEQQFGCFADVNLEGNLISSAKPIFFDLGGIAKGYAVDQAISLLPKSISKLLVINVIGDGPILDFLKKECLKKVALLGTKFTMEKGFYTTTLINNFGLDILIPKARDRQVVHDIIYNELVKGQFTNTSKQKIIGIIKELQNQGAEGVILGCTELPILISELDVTIPIFDTGKIHAYEAIEWSLTNL